jgi:hypothetical protein
LKKIKLAVFIIQKAMRKFLLKKSIRNAVFSEYFGPVEMQVDKIRLAEETSLFPNSEKWNLNSSS